MAALGRRSRQRRSPRGDHHQQLGPQERASHGAGVARDGIGQTHDVSFDVTWTGFGRVETTVNGPGSKRQQRAALATGRVTFDGAVLVDGPANHPTRPAPFIRVDTEK